MYLYNYSRDSRRIDAHTFLWYYTPVKPLKYVSVAAEV
jgi:hypothetical protein